MTRHYTCKTPPDETPACCYPERAKAICPTCTRWRSAIALPADQRQFVIIDASWLGSNTECPMHEARPSVRHFAEVDHA